MHFDIITCLPDLLVSPFQHSIMKRAQDKGLVSIHIHNLRDYGIGSHRQIDDYQYGGGAGMVMMCEPLASCLDELMEKHEYDEVIFLTPDGVTLKQGVVNKLSLGERIIMIAGHYKGIDERIRENYVTLEISIGDFVLSGGELPICLLVDAISRVIPGVISDGASALTDSHQDNLLSPPVYTRPAEFRGWQVPEILLSGNDAKIEEWRDDQAIQRTQERRPDLLLDDAE